MKPADTVQVRQSVGGVASWIYAKVVTANADGSALVIVRHPGNLDHGKLDVFTKGDIRTKATVEDLASKATGRDRMALLSQAEWLS